MAAEENRVVFANVEEFICSFEGCSKLFNKPSRLQEHERIHTGERPYVCPKDGCWKSYARSAHLRRHRDKTHQSEEIAVTAVISCEHCQQKFVSKDTLKKHILQIHGKSDNYACPIDGCSETFSKRFQLRHHIFQHRGVLPFQCHYEGCQKRFKQSSHLKRHLKSHEGYICSDCTQKFDKWSLLRKHKASEHPIVHQCDVCKKTFARQCLLRRHVRVAHSKAADIIYQCPESNCQRTFIDQRNVRPHVESFHGDHRRFVCCTDDCQRSFSTKQKLKQHITKVHSTDGCALPTKPRLNLHRKKSLIKYLGELSTKESARDEDLPPETTESVYDACHKNNSDNDNVDRCVDEAMVLTTVSIDCPTTIQMSVSPTDMEALIKEIIEDGKHECEPSSVIFDSVATVSQLEQLVTDSCLEINNCECG